jgi:CrcB protein
MSAEKGASLNYLIVFVGAGIGGALRHGVNVLAARLLGTGFPWGTLAVNVIGGFVMGVLAGWLALKAGEGWTQGLRLFAATGILGGFTTFSAFSLDTMMLWERGQAGLAAAYILVSVVLSVGGLVGGLAVVRMAS